MWFFEASRTLYTMAFHWSELYPTVEVACQGFAAG